MLTDEQRQQYIEHIRQLEAQWQAEVDEIHRWLHFFDNQLPRPGELDRAAWDIARISNPLLYERVKLLDEVIYYFELPTGEGVIGDFTIPIADDIQKTPRIGSFGRPSGYEAAFFGCVAGSALYLKARRLGVEPDEQFRDKAAESFHRWGDVLRSLVTLDNETSEGEPKQEPPPKLLSGGESKPELSLKLQKVNHKDLTSAQRRWYLELYRRTKPLHNSKAAFLDTYFESVPPEKTFDGWKDLKLSRDISEFIESQSLEHSFQEIFRENPGV